MMRLFEDVAGEDDVCTVVVTKTGFGNSSPLSLNLE